MTCPVPKGINLFWINGMKINSIQFSGSPGQQVWAMQGQRALFIVE
jgi:hypothetical protein